MPGKDYGPGGRWIHDRAHRIMEDSPETSKSTAYAIATQQAHKVGKSPKNFRTSQGVAESNMKYQLPKREYQKTASENPGEMSDIEGTQFSREMSSKWPHEGPGVRARDEQEALTTGSEKINREDNEGLLSDYFNEFGGSAKDVGKILSSALANFDKDAIAGSVAGQLAAEKYSSVTVDAFIDELEKIAGGLIGKILTSDIAPGYGPFPQRLASGFKGIGRLIKSQIKRHGVRGALS